MIALMLHKSVVVNVSVVWLFNAKIKKLSSSFTLLRIILMKGQSTSALVA